jgi:hypothetical protein
MQSVRDGSIFASFSRQGQQPVNISHCTHTAEDTRYVFHSYLIVSLPDEANDRAHIARWCAGSNHPFKVVEDREFITLMKAGCPGTSLPSPMTVSRDVKAAFERCRECIDNILKVCPGFYFFACH